MPVTPQDLATIQARVAPALGHAALRPVLQGHDAFRFDLGAAVTSRHGEGVDGNAWRLWVLVGAMWRLQTNDEVLVGSGDRRAKREAVLPRIAAQVLVAIETLAPAFATTMAFAGDLQLCLFPVHTRVYPYWAMLTPDNHVLQIGPGTTWFYRPWAARRGPTGPTDGEPGPPEGEGDHAP